MKKQRVKMGMQKLGKKEAFIEVYSDGSLGNMRGEKNQIGCVVSIRDGDGNTCPIMWNSKVAKRITRPTLDAETLAMGKELENGICIREILEDIYGERVEVVGYTDNKNQEEAVKSLKGVKNKNENRNSISERNAREWRSS